MIQAMSLHRRAMAAAREHEAKAAEAKAAEKPKALLLAAEQVAPKGSADAKEAAEKKKEAAEKKKEAAEKKELEQRLQEAQKRQAESEARAEEDLEGLRKYAGEVEGNLRSGHYAQDVAGAISKKVGREFDS